MPTKYAIMPMRLDDIALLAPNLREEDRKECSDLNMTPLSALEEGWKQGIAFSIWCDDEHAGWSVIGCFGCRSDGCAWSLYDDLTSADISFIFRNTTAWLRHLHIFANGRPLYNKVAESNTLARKWLERACNAAFGKRIYVAGRPYLPFTITQAAP